MPSPCSSFERDGSLNHLPPQSLCNRKCQLELCGYRNVSELLVLVLPASVIAFKVFHIRQQGVGPSEQACWHVVGEVGV